MPTPNPKPVEAPLNRALRLGKPAYASAKYLEGLGVAPGDVVALADAEVVLDRIDANPWITRDALATWSATPWGEKGVDRLNAAIALLLKAGMIGRLG
jgi:hypothetical protein